MELKCFQTWTGIKFVLTAEPGTHPDMSAVLQEIYVLYADCVAKDPFYELEMPIRSELFTQAVDALIDRVEKANTGSGGGIMGNNTSNSRNR
jgi:trafficking protein particle complex subunit 4